MNGEREDLERLDKTLEDLATLLFGMQLRKTDFVVFDRLDGEVGTSSVADYVDELTDPLHQIVKQRLREID